jgi:hypothetical protein
MLAVAVGGQDAAIAVMTAVAATAVEDAGGQQKTLISW